jgi:hypothetical protein
MNYYQARQREKDHRWDYTKGNDDDIRPVGYCAGWREWKPFDLYDEAHNDQWKREWEEKLLPHKDKYHSDGHATAEEAAECYKRYLLDHRLKLNLKDPNSAHKCEACGDLTQFLADLDSHYWILCERHNNRETVETLFESPGAIISSY